MQRFVYRVLAFAFVFAWLAGTAFAASDPIPIFQLPLDCDYGTTCFVQNYVDHDPGPGRADYKCGRLTYDGHHGTDFRLLDYVEMDRGYAVVAAADGVVRAMRDGMDDISIAVTGLAPVRGHEAGNGVVIDHGNGWTTQYSHMRKGSVTVHDGESVHAGQELGLVGLSGETVFPHVDFTVRHDGRIVDPFVGAGPDMHCGDTASPLWAPAVQAKLQYIASGLLRSYFADAVPAPEAARHGRFRLGSVSHNPPALILWADLFGVMRGDVEVFRIHGPSGEPVIDERRTRDESRVSWFSYAGLRRPNGGWPPGHYRGEYQLLRAGVVIARAGREIELLP